MLAACLMLSAALLLPEQQKPGATYADAVNLYVHRDLDGAAEHLGGLTETQIRRQVEALVAPALAPSRTSKDRVQAANGVSAAAKAHLEAAAMMHVEYALTADLDPSGVSLHVDLAHLLLSFDRLIVQRARLTSGPQTPEQAVDITRAEAYLPRWFAVATSTLLLAGLDKNARTLVDEEAKLFPGDPRAVFCHALVDEFQAVWDPPPLVETPLPAQQGRDPSGFDLLNETRRWGPAVAEYREVVAAQPDNQEARLHLAYGLMSMRRRDDARRELAFLQVRTTDVFVGYLTSLFLARLDEDARDDASAAIAYQRAIDLGPQFQTAYVGLSMVEDRRGHPERAHAIVARLAAIPDQSRKRDPWWEYRTARLPADDLEWLRAAVRQ
jgi:tetratricopeptide (TPR) repeat protein